MLRQETLVTSNSIRVSSAFCWTLRLGCARRPGAMLCFKPPCEDPKNAKRPRTSGTLNSPVRVKLRLKERELAPSHEAPVSSAVRVLHSLSLGGDFPKKVKASVSARSYRLTFLAASAPFLPSAVRVFAGSCDMVFLVFAAAIFIFFLAAVCCFSVIALQYLWQLRLPRSAGA